MVHFEVKALRQLQLPNSDPQDQRGLGKGRGSVPSLPMSPGYAETGTSLRLWASISSPWR